jgi:hypothetical protein
MGETPQSAYSTAWHRIVSGMYMAVSVELKIAQMFAGDNDLMRGFSDITSGSS